MFKFNRLVCVLFVCSLVSIVYAGAVRIPSFTVFEGETGADPDGMAILNYASGQDKTVVQIIVSDFTPNTSYDVQLVGSDGSTKNFGGVLNTDENGHGNAHIVCVCGDRTDNDILIYFDLGGEVEDLRAEGVNPNPNP